MLKKQKIGINPHAANNNYRDQSLTGIGGPRVYVLTQNKFQQQYSQKYENSGLVRVRGMSDDGQVVR